MTIEEKVREIIRQVEFFSHSWNNSIISIEEYTARKNQVIQAILALIKPMSREKVAKIVNKYYACDNINCGRGAICNYCALKKDLDAILAEWGKE